MVVAGLQHRIVRYAPHALVLEEGAIEVSRVVMIAANEYHPVVRIVQLLGISPIHLFVIRFLFKSKATITCHNEQGVRHLILDA
ncbi:hypothetical protein EVA_18747 [gut metagenome]|uniref:Uncharacterized protein n=1 Tax=gut metagenome TaxID=749906 RepID=J9G0Q8_9ZZZZ